MAKKVLITGGAGFIGSNLVDYINLKAPDWKIKVIDDLSSGLASNLQSSDCDLIVGTILDRELLSRVVSEVDHVIHLAAIGSVPRSIEAPHPTNEVNVAGTLNVLEAAREHSVGHVVVASSSSVYGSNPNLPRSEFDWTRPLSPYAVSKQATEAYANAYASSYGMKTVAFRFFNVYGPRQRSDHPYAAVIPKFVSATLANTTLTIHGDGMQTRDFTFVSSVCEALFESVRQDLDFDHPVNLAFGTKSSLLEIIKILEEIAGRKLKVVHSPCRAGDVKASQADTSLLNSVLPNVSNFDLKSGLELTMEWFEHASLAKP